MHENADEYARMLAEPVLVGGAMERFFLGRERWTQQKIRAEVTRARAVVLVGCDCGPDLSAVGAWARTLGASVSLVCGGKLEPPPSPLLSFPDADARAFSARAMPAREAEETVVAYVSVSRDGGGECAVAAREAWAKACSDPDEMLERNWIPRCIDATDVQVDPERLAGRLRLHS